VRLASLGVLLVAASLTACGLRSSRPEPPGADAGPRARAVSVSGQDAGPAASAAALCVHQRREGLGAPVHLERGGKGGFVRLRECTRLARIEGDDAWVRVAFPEVEGRTEGWISGRYVMGCSACGEADAGEAGSWPPRPRGLCEGSTATGREGLSAAEPRDRASHGRGAKGRPGARLTVASWNVWELYDGQGEARYLGGEAHGGVPAAQFPLRLVALSRGLASLEVDVLVLQEVESAAVACVLAGRAWPRSGWTCAATEGRRGALPQNLAVATRLEAGIRVLSPVDRAESGPRPALELSFEGAGGLTLTGVHLKSSVGRSTHEDCRNARQRMGMAAALARRYQGWSSVLLLGDFNVDPLDSERAIYDRTDDVLTGRGFVRLCPPSPAGGCRVGTWRGRSGPGSAIDLAFFRGGARWRPLGVRVLASTPHPSRTTLGSDHFPLVVDLAR
jgi:endonuclease/exonuclease/phosphatase family metal-dependent hydrolase